MEHIFQFAILAAGFLFHYCALLYLASITASATAQICRPRNGVTQGIMPALGSVRCVIKVTDTLWPCSHHRATLSGYIPPNMSRAAMLI